MNSSFIRSLTGQPPKVPRIPHFPRDLLRDIITFNPKKLEETDVRVSNRIPVDYGCRDEAIEHGKILAEKGVRPNVCFMGYTNREGVPPRRVDRKDEAKVPTGVHTEAHPKRISNRERMMLARAARRAAKGK